MSYGRGYIPDSHDTTRDQTTRALFGARMGLPAAASLEQFVSQIYDQGQTSSCTGWAFSRAVQVRLQAMGRPFFQPSPSALYTFGRAEERVGSGLTPEEQPLRDQGAQPWLVAKGMQEWGIPSIAEWPFDPSTIDDEPDLAELECAQRFVLQGYHRIDAQGEDRCNLVRQSIYEGFPVCIGVGVDQAFEDWDGSKPLGAPDPNHLLGGHMLCIVAYKSDGTFRVVNQWGRSWGQSGMITATEDFLTNSSVGDIVVVSVS